MQNFDKCNFSDPLIDDAGATSELEMLRDVLRMLPAGVTVLDEQGRFVLMNDAAAAQLGIGTSGMASGSSLQLDQRRNTGFALLRDGRSATSEESVSAAGGPQTLLTAHRPIRSG